jgi:hypothetical protein
MNREASLDLFSDSDPRNQLTDDGAIHYIFEQLGADSPIIKILSLVNQGLDRETVSLSVSLLTSVSSLDLHRNDLICDAYLETRSLSEYYDKRCSDARWVADPCPSW